jgi:hypothetical protein
VSLHVRLDCGADVECAAVISLLGPGISSPMQLSSLMDLRLCSVDVATTNLLMDSLRSAFVIRLISFPIYFLNRRLLKTPSIFAARESFASYFHIRKSVWNGSVTKTVGLLLLKVSSCSNIFSSVRIALESENDLVLIAKQNKTKTKRLRSICESSIYLFLPRLQPLL